MLHPSRVDLPLFNRCEYLLRQDDSYAVNSESMGPWGDAIMYELLPYIESTFRGIGEGWARFCYGGSTGGWESLAVQLKYPDVRLILH